jgi:hypothetical protein
MKASSKGTASHIDDASVKGTLQIGAAANGKKKGGAAQQAADAEKLLKADHRKVEKLFTQYKSANDDKKAELIKQICSELIVHTKLEEELFYPACREKNVEDSDLDEAQVEHDGAKVLIAELINCSPDDDYIDAKVTVLSEYIKHHVGEEEEPSEGIFTKARKAGVDMNAIGARIQARKSKLMEDIDSLSSTTPKTPSLGIDLSHTARSNQENYTMPRYPRDEQSRYSNDDENNGRSRGSSRYASRSGSDQNDDYSGRGEGRTRYAPGSEFDNDDYSRGGNNQRGYRERDQMVRAMSENDDYRGRDFSSSRRGYENTDEQNSGRGSRDYQQDEEGRFSSGYSGSRSSSRGTMSGSGSQFGDQEGRSARNSPEQRNWFGEPERYSQSGERDWDNRNTGRMSQSRRSGRDYDDNDRSSWSGGVHDSRHSGEEGHGGWYGYPSRNTGRGWQNR